MTVSEFIKRKGLTVRLVAQEMGVTRQAIEQYGKQFVPTAKTLKRLAQAMTVLGVPTTPADIVAATYE